MNAPALQSPAALLDDVAALARVAGTEILEVYASDFEVHHKDDRSPLTAADLRAQRVLVTGLERLTPGVPIVSEESPVPPLAERRGWEWLWLVDPLDGTREFVDRSGEFTVNVALVHRGRPVLGVVHVPVAGLDYCGAEGVGAFRREADGRSRPIRARTRAAAPPRVVASRSHRGTRLDSFLARLGPHELHPAGSALKFGLVAEGAADVYPRLGPTSEWDTAAGHAVAVAAGAQVVDLDGRPLEYNARESIVNPDFVCFADPGPGWVERLRTA